VSGENLILRVVEWSAEEPAIRAIREEVFIREQDVPPHLEWDGLDPGCLHLLVEDKKERPIATSRITPDGKIGRMAVLADWRGMGIGLRMLEKMLELARERGLKRVVLDAQTRALGFYGKLGFKAEGDEFLDAGIPHFRMVLELNSNS
jgi:predicted GNAT family N-acyltransferase